MAAGAPNEAALDAYRRVRDQIGAMVRTLPESLEQTQGGADMIRSGLVSVTFRQLTPERIVQLVAGAGLDGIEWGGDVHVPHGDVERAREVRTMTAEAGLEVVSYGSYYRAAHSEPAEFDGVLASAVELRAPLIRVWAGGAASEEADEQYRRTVVEDSRRIAELARQEGIGIAFEFHANTLTDTNESALNLFQSIEHDNIGSYWQPITHATVQYRIEGLKNIMPWLRHLHVFQRNADNGRVPLAEPEAEACWRHYLQTVLDAGGDHFAMVEFVKDDAPEKFLRDAEVLRRWLDELQRPD